MRVSSFRAYTTPDFQLENKSIENSIRLIPVSPGVHGTGKIQKNEASIEHRFIDSLWAPGMPIVDAWW